MWEKPIKNDSKPLQDTQNPNKNRRFTNYKRRFDILNLWIDMKSYFESIGISQNVELGFFKGFMKVINRLKTWNI